MPGDSPTPYIFWTPSPTPVPTPSPTPFPTVEDAKAYLLEQLGPEEAACLSSIIAGESRWRVTVWNGGQEGGATPPPGSSGAYGLGQAKPADKMAPYGADYMTNPVTQVKWAIAYAQDRYGSACNAARFRSGWYDRDGVLHPGRGWW
jgi:hypothetical protein